MTDIISAILALDPNAEVSVSGESLDGIEWHDGTQIILPTTRLLQNKKSFKQIMIPCNIKEIEQ